MNDGTLCQAQWETLKQKVTQLLVNLKQIPLDAMWRLDGRGKEEKKSARKLQQGSKQRVMVARFKEVETDRTGRNDKKWPGNESQNARPYLKALLCPPVLLHTV